MQGILLNDKILFLKCLFLNFKSTLEFLKEKKSECSFRISNQTSFIYFDYKTPLNFRNEPADKFLLKVGSMITHLNLL